MIAVTLQTLQRLNEYMMISLRTLEGMDLGNIRQNWGPVVADEKELQLAKYVKQGLILMENDHARLTDEGMLHADGIASDLFVIEEKSKVKS